MIMQNKLVSGVTAILLEKTAFLDLKQEDIDSLSGKYIAKDGRPMGQTFTFKMEDDAIPRDQRIAHFSRVSFLVKVGIAFDPVHMGLFGTDGVVFDPYGVTLLIEHFLPVVFIASPPTGVGFMGAL